MGVELDLQKAIVTRLVAEASGIGYTARRVYDRRPQDDYPDALPVITIGEIITTNSAVDEMDTFDALIRIHSWTFLQTVLEVKKMQGEVYEALHNRALLLPSFEDDAVTNYVCYSILRENTRILSDPDATFHGVCEYRALIYSAA